MYEHKVSMTYNMFTSCISIRFENDKLNNLFRVTLLRKPDEIIV